ncbi:Endomembrane protein 70-domain-containing protein [Russula aff. rugulosa BPL654]|nr:Endomembrane protein 70-domain-containing protein [Russula aff. rugulosa BPL654]
MSASRLLIRATLVALVASSIPVHAFYLPGAAPHDYRVAEKVDLFVNALTPMLSGSDDAKLRSLINFFTFVNHKVALTNNPSLWVPSSSVIVRMLEDNGTCKSLCVSSIPAEDAKFINDRIREDYALNWLIDGLPAAEMKIDMKSGDMFFDMGFNLGNDDGPNEDRPQLYNHYDIVLRRGGSQDGVLDCDSRVPPLTLGETEENRVRYSYRVMWNESSTPWATRWDNYLHIFDPRIHWFSLINSLVIVVFLCAMVSMIVYRSVSRDEDVQEDWGWKLVHGEVFRTPNNPLVLAALVVFALLGFLSPSNRGSLATVMMICWTFFGSVGGYISSRVYVSLGGTERGKNAFLTATVLPTFIFAVVFLLNLFLIAAGSSGAVPFGTLLLIVLLWFGISAPLSAIGAYFGTGRGAISHPVRVNAIPRQIPAPPNSIGRYSPIRRRIRRVVFCTIELIRLEGLLRLWFLALTAGVVGLTTATVTILFTYFLLCAEEYRWHWRAFVTGGGSAFWLLAYGLFYWMSRLSLDSFSSVVLYLGYLSLLVVLDFLVTGTIGFLAAYWAVRSCMARLGSTKVMDTVILDVCLITRPLALIPVAGNYSTRPMSSCIADMLDRKEINALNYRTRPCMPVPEEKLPEWTHCITVHTQGVELALLLVMRGLPFNTDWTLLDPSLPDNAATGNSRQRKMPSAWERTYCFLQRHNESQCGFCMDFARTNMVTITIEHSVVCQQSKF